MKEDKQPNIEVYKHTMVENLLSEERRQGLIQWYQQHRHLESVGSEEDYVGIRYIHIHNRAIREDIQRMYFTLIGEIRKISDQVVWPEMISIARWHLGGIQAPHVDTYSNDEFRENNVDENPSREWTCILYLNDDYSGGETYFPPCEQYPFGGQIEPKAGSGLLFQGIYIPHGVFKIRRNYRYTVAFWFTTNQERMMPDGVVKNLELNEISTKIADAPKNIPAGIASVPNK